MKHLVIVAGMPRVGTTFLYHNLQLHPDIFLPKRKEIGFFSYRYHEGIKWFLDYYKDISDEQVPFDICPIYCFDHDVIDRILDMNQDAKVILGLRDPTSWAFSWHEQIRSYSNLLPFQQFIKEGFSFERDGKKLAINFEDGRIATIITNYKKVFGKQLLLFDFSILKKSPLSLLKAIESFSGIRAYFEEGNFINRRINASGRKTNRLFNQLLLARGVSDLVTKLLPRKLLQFIRSWVETNSLKNNQVDEWKNKFSEEDRRVAEEVFQKDKLFIEELFKGSPIRLGDSV